MELVTLRDEHITQADELVTLRDEHITQADLAVSASVLVVNSEINECETGQSAEPKGPGRVRSLSRSSLALLPKVGKTKNRPALMRVVSSSPPNAGSPTLKVLRSLPTAFAVAAAYS